MSDETCCDLMIPAAICYDFDGTLVPGVAQEYAFIKDLNVEPKEFWRRCEVLSRKNKMDGILAYMLQMKIEMQRLNRPLTYHMLKEGGKRVDFFPGVESWFERINAYALKKGISLEHYVISSGLKEIIEGTRIAPYFKAIFAASFLYDEGGNAFWPALSVNYTNKTQFLFRINKGCLDTGEHVRVNSHMNDEDKPMPFSHMIYIGDGDTDVPSMKVVKLEQGYAAAVYPEDIPGAYERVAPLMKNNRVDLVAAADYREGGDMDVFVKTVLDKIKTSAHLESFKKTRGQL